MMNNPNPMQNPAQITMPIQQLMPTKQLIPMQSCMPMPQVLVMPNLATAYVPFQYLNCLYPPMRGLGQGTIFPELDRPYGVDPEYTADA
jgi:hypothetical protein